MYHAIITTVQDSNKFSRKTKTPSAMFAAKGVCTGHVQWHAREYPGVCNQALELILTNFLTVFSLVP